MIINDYGVPTVCGIVQQGFILLPRKQVLLIALILPILPIEEWSPRPGPPASKQRSLGLNHRDSTASKYFDQTAIFVIPIFYAPLSLPLSHSPL